MRKFLIAIMILVASPVFAQTTPAVDVAALNARLVIEQDQLKLIQDRYAQQIAMENKLITTLQAQIAAATPSN